MHQRMDSWILKWDVTVPLQKDLYSSHSLLKSSTCSLLWVQTSSWSPRAFRNNQLLHFPVGSALHSVDGPQTFVLSSCCVLDGLSSLSFTLVGKKSHSHFKFSSVWERESVWESVVGVRECCVCECVCDVQCVHDKKFKSCPKRRICGLCEIILETLEYHNWHTT
jgi:hypothetical protein